MSLLLGLALAVSTFACTAQVPPRGPFRVHGELAVHIEAGEFVRVVIDQQEDVAIQAFGPNKQQLASTDAFEFGEESITLIVLERGNYRFVAGAPLGRTSAAASHLSVAERGVVGPGVFSRECAERLTTDGRRLRKRGGKVATDEAVQLLAQAVDLWRDLADAPSQARTLLSLGDANLARSLLAEAKSNFDSAEALCVRWGDSTCRATALNNVALTEWQMGELGAAQSHFSEAGRLWNVVRSRRGEAATRNNLGLLARQTGDWQEALRQYGTAARLFQKVDPFGEAMTLNNAGMLNLSLSDAESAIRLLSRAVTLLRSLDEPVALGKACMNLGRCYMLQGNLAVAGRWLQEASRLLMPREDLRATAECINNLGQLAWRNRDYVTARGRLEDALARHRTIGDRRGEASALHHLGMVEFGQRRNAAALALFQQAREIRMGIQAFDDAAESQYRVALMQKAVGDLGAAHVTIAKLLDEIESLRARIFGERYRSSYFQTKASYYELAVQIASEAGNTAEAFEIGERGRARAALDALAESKEALVRSTEPSLWGEQRALAARLRFLRQTGAQQESMGDLFRVYRNLESELSARLWESSRYPEPNPLQLAEIQQRLLDEDTLVLSYWIGQERSHLWAISANTTHYFQLPPRRTIDPAARKVIDLVRRVRERQTNPDLQAAFQKSRSSLSQLLLGPLTGLLTKRRVVVVADGVLHYVPFEALRFSDAGGATGGTPGDFLGLRFEVVRLPSASSLDFIRAVDRRRRESRKVLVLADPVFDRGDSRVRGAHPTASASARGASWASNWAPQRLPLTIREAQVLGGYLPSSQTRILTGFAASREALLGQASDYDVIHIASHAIADDKNPEMSGLILSLVHEDGRSRDGYIRLFEIGGLNRFHCELVVLSACRTSLGPLDRGEGMIGLARAFLLAGSARVMASLWDVEDLGTSEFMRRFYTRVAGTQSFDPWVALLETRQGMAKSSRWGDPFYWAGFAAYGDWR